MTQVATNVVFEFTRLLYEVAIEVSDDLTDVTAVISRQGVACVGAVSITFSREFPGKGEVSKPVHISLEAYSASVNEITKVVRQSFAEFIRENSPPTLRLVH